MNRRNERRNQSGNRNRRRHYSKSSHSPRYSSYNGISIDCQPVPGFPVFAVFYRLDGQTLTVIALEDIAQDLPARRAGLLSAP